MTSPLGREVAPLPHCAPSLHIDLSVSRSLLEASWPNREEELHSTCSYPQPLLSELGPCLSGVWRNQDSEKAC